MRHGDIVSVKPDVLLIPPKILEPLGIYDGAECWGLWVQGEKAPRFIDNPEHDEMPFRFPHLVISPVRPELWPMAFRASFELNDRENALLELCDELHKLHPNYLCMDSAPSGFRHSTFETIAECDLLSRRIRDLESEQPLEQQIVSKLKAALSAASDAHYGEHQREADRVRRALFKRIGLEMFLGLTTLRLRIRNAESENFDASGDRRDGFLRSQVVELGSAPYFLPREAIDAALAAGTIPEIVKTIATFTGTNGDADAEEAQTVLERWHDMAKRRRRRDGELTPEAIDATRDGKDAHTWLTEAVHEMHREHRLRPITLHALTGLAHASTWRVRFDRDQREVKPVRLRCNAMEGGLKVVRADGGSWDKVISSFYNIKDMRFEHAIVSMDPTSASLRVRFMRSCFIRRRTVRARVHYDYTEPEDRTMKASEVASSKRMLRPFLQHLVRGAGGGPSIDLLRVSNKIQKLEKRREVGEVRFIIVHDESDGVAAHLKGATASLPELFRELGIKVTVELGSIWWPILISVPPDLSDEDRRSLDEMAAVTNQRRAAFGVRIVERGTFGALGLALQDRAIGKVSANALLQVIRRTDGDDSAALKSLNDEWDGVNQILDAEARDEAKAEMQTRRHRLVRGVLHCRDLESHWDPMDGDGLRGAADHTAPVWGIHHFDEPQHFDHPAPKHSPNDPSEPTIGQSASAALDAIADSLRELADQWGFARSQYEYGEHRPDDA